MKRGITVLVGVCLLAAGVYFAISKWGIRHETLDLIDAARQRPVSVDLAVRRDYEIKAEDGFWKLPVAIISNGNTVKNTEYSFLANTLAAKGYLVASIQQDLPSDPPLMTKPGEPYVGRREVGHSNGGDISMYYAKHHPEMVAKVITLDNLRVPFVTGDKMKILSFRSNDPNFKTDPGVLPSTTQAVKDGIDIIKTPFQHTEMSDRGPDSVKEKIQEALDHFLTDSSSSELSPNNTDNPLIAKPPATTPPAPAPAAPVVSNPAPPTSGPTRSGS